MAMLQNAPRFIHLRTHSEHSLLEGAIPVKKLAGHFHDTRGQALANVQAAYKLGVRVFDMRESVGRRDAAGGTAPAAVQAQLAAAKQPLDRINKIV